MTAAGASPRAVLLRHGQTEWSRTGRHTGRTDIPLTDAGRLQARLAGPALASWTFARVLVSPLSRARETAALAGLSRAEVRDDLAEWDYGDVEGHTTDEVRAAHPGWLLWRDGVPGGETIDEVGRRADRVIAEVRATEGDVCLVAHGHLLRVLGARWLGYPPVDGCHLALDTATISVLGDEHGIACLLRWNDGSHLRAGAAAEARAPS
ncbi:MAG TPA: histidine phosphatase family protein [Candidatus Dormibacteraeota bacterium]|nr:histidine phosphatase family protein [Candidatus Dormibacteraeota bacterium]